MGSITRVAVLVGACKLAFSTSILAFGKFRLGLAQGELQLHGWVYDIRSGEVEAWDEAEGKFITIDSRYAAQIRELAGDHTCAA